MSRRLTRQQMKRDEVGEALSRTMAYLSGHLKLVAIGIGVIVAVFVLGLLIDRLIGGRREGASDDLAAAIETLQTPLANELPDGAVVDQTVFDSAEERFARARGQFEELATRRSKTGRIAKSYLASIAFRQGDVEAARGIWLELADGDDNVLALEAELNLISLDRDAGRAEEVEKRLSAALDGETALPADALLYELALTQEALGKTEESLETYQRLLEEHPQSTYSAEARRKTTSLGAPDA